MGDTSLPDLDVHPMSRKDHIGDLDIGHTSAYVEIAQITMRGERKLGTERTCLWRAFAVYAIYKRWLHELVQSDGGSKAERQSGLQLKLDGKASRSGFQRDWPGQDQRVGPVIASTMTLGVH